MKKIIPLFVLAFSICLMWSCEKENVAPTSAVTKQINSTDSYLANVGIKVLFASLTIDHQAETLSGWLIDDKGDLRKIKHDISLSLRDEIVTGATVNGLHTNSELIKELDKDVLVSFHKSASKFTPNRSITTETNQTSTTAFVSYQLNAGDTDGHDCSDDHNTDAYTVETFQQKLLVATGHLNQDAATQVQEINKYLQAFAEEVGN